MIDKASAAIAGLSKRYQQALIAAITANDPRYLSALSLRLDRIADQFRDELQRALYDSQVAGYVVGASKSIAPLARGLAGDGILPPIPLEPLKLIYPSGAPSIEFPVIDKAIEILNEAGIMSPSDYYSLTATAKRDAFTITADITEATAAEVQIILQENVAAGASRSQFIADVESKIGSLPINEAHLEQVFRNNVNAAYSDGAEAVLAEPMVEDAFPYRAYYPIRDDRARKTHLRLEFCGLNGTNVYHKNDPVWLMFRPPWDWNCRCGWTPITIRVAARKGVLAAKVWLETGIEPPDQFVEWPSIDGEAFFPSESWQRLAL